MTGSMISAVAFCPHPPLLVPQIAAGAATEAELLRSACSAALGRVLSAPCAQILIIGSDSPTRGLQGFAPGVEGLPDADLPPSLAIGDWLLDLTAATQPRRFLAVRPDGTPSGERPDLEEPTALLVMGDGSARRSAKGPGYIDERAEEFDELVVSALADADTRALAELDPGLATELLVSGVGPWKATAHLVGAAARSSTENDWHGEVRYADAPYGVMYVVALWLPG